MLSTIKVNSRLHCGKKQKTIHVMCKLSCGVVTVKVHYLWGSVTHQNNIKRNMMLHYLHITLCVQPNFESLVKNLYCHARRNSCWQFISKASAFCDVLWKCAPNISFTRDFEMWDFHEAFLPVWLYDYITLSFPF